MQILVIALFICEDLLSKYRFAKR